MVWLAELKIHSLMGESQIFNERVESLKQIDIIIFCNKLGEYLEISGLNRCELFEHI